MEQNYRLLGGVLLVAGTTIGGGMLGLPILIGTAGFIPSLFVSFLCWLFMASTGLLFLEVSQWIKGESNIISMAECTLGLFGKYFAWTLYLFLFNCLLIAYLVGAGNLLSELFFHSLPSWAGPLLFALFFSPLIIISTVITTRLNSFLVLGLALSYLGVVILGARYVSPELLKQMYWSHSIHILPIAFISFGFQGIIPTLTTYMQRDFAQTRRALLIGSFIPFVAYAIWNGVILGIVPVEGEAGLLDALSKGQNAITPLKNFISDPLFYQVGQAFAFFALVTSFLGVALGLRDFLADGLKIKKNFSGKCLLAFLVCAFPLVIAISYPHLFLVALGYAGGFGSALLLGLLPIIMAWSGRYYLHLEEKKRQLPGGKGVLLLLTLFVCFELFMETRLLIEKLFF